MKINDPGEKDKDHPRTMTGFFARLTKEQQDSVLVYTGDDTVGDSDFMRELTRVYDTEGPEAAQKFQDEYDHRSKTTVATGTQHTPKPL